MLRKVGIKGLIIILGFCLFFPSTALADTNRGNNYAKDVTSPYALLYLKYWSVEIIERNNGALDISGVTESYEDVDNIKIELYLQYWDGYEWKDAAYLGEFKEENSNYIRAEVPGNTVEGGYYYRTRGVHSVNESGTEELANSHSGSVYID